MKSLDPCNRISSSDAPPPSPQPPFLCWQRNKTEMILLHSTCRTKWFSERWSVCWQFLGLCCAPQSRSAVPAWFFVSGMHMMGESQSNKTSPPIPPLQVEECALWHAFSVSHVKDPQNNMDPHPRLSVVCAESSICMSKNPQCHIEGGKLRCFSLLLSPPSDFMGINQPIKPKTV